MKEIILKRGETVLVDDEDFEELNKYSWYKGGRGYTVRANKEYKRGSNSKIISMHRQLMGFPVGLLVDHIDGNKLNNQKGNLRIVTASGNSCNRHTKSKGKSSRYFGVYRNSPSGSWYAVLNFGGKIYNLGAYQTEIEAAIAYNIKAKDLGFLTQNEVDMSTPIKRLRTGSRRIIYPGLVSPEGIVYRDIESLPDFCKDHGISASTINIYYKQKKTTCKGWTILYEYPSEVSLESE
jgi:hypothetical protein